jgi:hypothetical protein
MVFIIVLNCNVAVQFVALIVLSKTNDRRHFFSDRQVYNWNEIITTSIIKKVKHVALHKTSKIEKVTFEY